jgi:hypothetical protein
MGSQHAGWSGWNPLGRSVESAQVISGEPSVAFEKLYLALVLFRVLSCLESAEVTAPARLGISFFRIEPVFTRFQSSNHFSVLSFNSPSSPDPV